MNRLALAVIVFVAMLASVFGVASVVRAQGESLMTEAHIERIRTNCIEAQSALTQLHATDALLRVNRGQLYELISTKLMAPFNSRVTLNKMDASTLVAISTGYERQLADFRSRYQQYEQAMSAVLRINCVNQPVAFYDAVVDTRAKRSNVHDSTVALQQSIGAYGDEFEAFATWFAEDRS